MRTLDQSFHPDPDVVATDLGQGETVLLHLKSKAYYSLNPTGTRIWRGIERGLSPGEISRNLQEEFDIDPARADRSVQDLLSELTRQKLVQSAPLEDTKP